MDGNKNTLTENNKSSTNKMINDKNLFSIWEWDFDWEEYYNSEDYLQAQEEIEKTNKKISQIDEKYCYGYDISKPWWISTKTILEFNNCYDNHICINSCLDTPILVLDEENISKNCILNENLFSEEENKAFKLFCETNVINDIDINQSNLHNQLTRSEMAEIISSYATKFLNMSKDTTKSCWFKDVCQWMWDWAVSVSQYAGIHDACQLNLMWVWTSYFNPNWLVKRADFGTVLSRMLRGDKYNNMWNNWYDWHLRALNSAWIMNNVNPEIQELKSRVLLMLYRNAQNMLWKSAENVIENNNTTNVNIFFTL